MEKEIPITPASKWTRFLYAFVGIFMPIASFIVTFKDILNPDWQNGKISAYTAIMLGGTVARYFYPLLTYSILSFALLLFSPNRFEKHFIIRLGIYTGTILSLQYAILVGITSEGIFFGIALLGIALLYIGFRWLYKKIGVRKTLYLVIGVYLLWGILAISVDGIEGIFQPLAFFAVFFFGTAPSACLLIASLLSYKLIKKYELPKKNYTTQGFGLLIWVSSFIAIWRVSFFKMMEVYAALPESPPDCYIATASAKGHPKFVKSEPVIFANGQAGHVNAQLRTLKYAELALMAISPRLHKFLRKIYDVVGQALAKKITHPLLADMSYLALKPFEWTAKIALKVLIEFKAQV